MFDINDISQIHSHQDSFKTDGAVDINFLELVKLLNTFRKLTGSMDTRPTIAPYKDLDMKKIGALFNEDIVRQGDQSLPIYVEISN